MKFQNGCDREKGEKNRVSRDFQQSSPRGLTPSMTALGRFLNSKRLRSYSFILDAYVDTSKLTIIHTIQPPSRSPPAQQRLGPFSQLTSILVMFKS